MKGICTTIVAALTMSALAAATGIDGKWSGETKVSGRNGGEERTVAVTLTLKSEGGAVTGSLEQRAGKRGKPAEIKNGKLEGDQLSFETSRSTKKKGEVVQHWTGTLEGDQLTLSSSGKGKGKGKRSNSITLKRQV